MTHADIDVIHHVPAKKGKNTIARFCLRIKKVYFISNAIKGRLTTTDLDLPLTPGTPVFINEHLTPDNKRLFAQGLTLKKERKKNEVFVDQWLPHQGDGNGGQPGVGHWERKGPA